MTPLNIFKRNSDNLITFLKRSKNKTWSSGFQSENRKDFLQFDSKSEHKIFY